MQRRDQRSPDAQGWRKLYKTAAWQKARKAQLQREPICRFCKKTGKIVPANTCDHIKEHKGIWALFIDPNNHQSLCGPCHSSIKQSFERTGIMRPVIGNDGWPV